MSDIQSAVFLEIEPLIFYFPSFPAGVEDLKRVQHGNFRAGDVCHFKDCLLAVRMFSGDNPFTCHGAGKMGQVWAG